MMERRYCSASSSSFAKTSVLKRDVTFHAAPMQKLHQLRQIRFGEIVRAHPRIEFFQAKINRVRAVLDRGFGAFPIARGREEFWECEFRFRDSIGWRADWIWFPHLGRLR